MTVTRDELTAAILAPVTQIFRRVDIYESDGVTRWGSTNRLIEGSVSVDYSRDERRSMDCTLENLDGSLTSTPDGFWYDKILVPVYSVLTDAGVADIQLAKLMIDRISESGDSATVKVTTRDFTKKMLLSKFRQATAFSAGQSVEQLIKTLATNSGVTDFLIPANTKVLAADVTFEANTSRWEAAKQVATAYNYEIFFNELGYLVVREYLDPVTSPTSFSFRGGRGGSLVSYEKSTNDTRLFNHVVVTGDTGDNTLPIVAEAVNTEPSSPTRVSKIGDRVFPYESAFIASQQQADDLALSLLRINALEEYDLNFSAVAIPWLGAGEIVELVTPKDDPRDPTRFLLSSLTIPLALGPMTGNGKRVAVVG